MMKNTLIYLFLSSPSELGHEDMKSSFLRLSCGPKDIYSTENGAGGTKTILVQY